jgi:hypothetical protein
MGYYIRILGISDPDIHLDRLLDDLKAEGLTAKINIQENQTPDCWSLIQVANSNDLVIAQIERNPVIEGELGFDELNEFREEIIDYKPDSSVAWLTKYFDGIKVIYAFQLLNDCFTDDNYSIISAIRNSIWNIIGGIMQADNEGFSNENGYHILWQFSDSVTGDWHMALLNKDSQWIKFRMDLGDKEQREEFKNGLIPQKAVKL